jgi:transposase
VVGPEREAGGKLKLGPISKRGNGYLRRLLVNGAMAVLLSRPGRPRGSAGCSPRGRASWSPARSPTRWRGSRER